MPDRNGGSTSHINRREVLASVGTGLTVASAGCLDAVPLLAADRNETTTEVTTVNDSNKKAYVSVIIGDDEDVIFQHTFIVNSGNSISHGEISRKPEKIIAFTREGISETWNYDPDLSPEFTCNIKEIGFTIKESQIEPWYSC